MKTITTFLLLILLFGVAYAQEEGDLQLVVKVENIKDLKGKMKFAIYDESDQFLKEAIDWGDTDILDHSVEFTFKGLKEGIYAVSIFQDENDNGELDSNFIGIPKEPYAFSNNAKGTFGPPSFEDCHFQLVDDNKEIIIRL